MQENLDLAFFHWLNSMYWLLVYSWSCNLGISPWHHLAAIVGCWELGYSLGHLALSFIESL